MQKTRGGQKWERTPKLTLEEFLEENIDNISNDYLESYPEHAYKINDGDIECVYDWLQEKDTRDSYQEIMEELYHEMLEENALHEEIIADDIAHEGVRERQAVMD